LLVDRCRVNDLRAATVDEITEYVTARLAALPMNKMIVLQHGNYIDDAVLHRAKQIQRAAERHGVPVVDTRAALTQQPLDQIYNGYHHSKRGNEIVARVIASELER
jgi:cob(I)alamin adenosyltransferase